MHDTQKTVILNGMSELGPELPPEVYRRRRIVAVVVLILVLLVGIVGITTLVNQINKGPQDDAAAEATAAGEPFQNFSARPTPSTVAPSGSVSGSASGSPNASATPSVSGTPAVSGSATPSGSASASATPAVALCNAKDLKVTVEPSKKQYAPGEMPSFHVVCTNSAGNPCFIGGEKVAEGVEINITSGDTQVYSSAKCTPTPTKRTEIPAGKEAASDVAWDRKLNTSGCNALKNTAKGTYWVTATVNGVTSQRVNFLLK